MEQRYHSVVNEEMNRIFEALQDDLSKKLFWGRMHYCFEHTLSSVYLSMISDEHLAWASKRKLTGVENYGVPPIWELIKDNYPVQKDKIFVRLPSYNRNDFQWMIDRFVRALAELKIQIEGFVISENGEVKTQNEETPITDDQYIEKYADKSKLVIGCPIFSSEAPTVIKYFKQYKDRLYLLEDFVEKQYIEHDFLIPQKNEVYVDVGVYDLQSSLDFIEWAKEGFKKIYAFEPDHFCYERSKRNLESLKPDIKNRIKLVNKGLSMENGLLTFPAEYKMSGEVEETVLAEVVAFDDYYKSEDAVTMIKMDVEGAEMDVLQGMKNTIIKYKPRLAVCVYHQHIDLMDITTYLLKLVPEYRFYLRHYATYERETVLFCVV